MLPLRPFNIIQPESLAALKEALKLAGPRSKIIAGGTDLVPNLKHGLYDIDQLISLKQIADLKTIGFDNNRVSIGALVKVSELAGHQDLSENIPALSLAASQIASPQIRNMATVGGNICLDTRCYYFNQTEFWRNALGYCLKKDGNACHVVKTGKRCVAAASNDLATVFLALKARIKTLSPLGEKDLLLDDFYSNNGEKNNILDHNEIVTSVYFDINSDYEFGFYKLRHRASIDFSLLSLAAAINVDSNKTFVGGDMVVNALVAKPKIISLNQFGGRKYDGNLVNHMADLVAKKCHPQTNISVETSWRKDMMTSSSIWAFKHARDW